MSRLFRICLVAVASALTIATAAAQSLKVGDDAPPIKVAKWIKGAPDTNFKDGKVHIVEFWATWCGPCKVSIPHLTEVAKKYKDKVDVIGVSVWEVGPDEKDPAYMEKVEKFVADMGEKMDYRVAVDGLEGTMAKTWMEAAGQDGIPAAFIVGKDGKIAWIGHPMMDMDRVLDQVLNGTFDTKAEAARQQKAREEAEARQKLFEPLQKAMMAGDTKTAAAEVDKLIAADPKLEMQLGALKFELLLDSNEAEAYKYAAKLSDGVYKDDPMALNNIAWAIVDDEKELKTRDVKLAIRLAEKAVKLSKEQDPYSMDTLAYAYFRDNQVDKAITTQVKALDLAAKDSSFDPDTLKEMRDRLAKFRQKKGS